MEPWAAGEPWKLWRRIAPWNPLPLEVPITSTHWPAEKRSTPGSSAAFGRQFGSFHAEFLEELGGLNAQFLEVAGLRLSHTAFLLRIKGNLNGIVAIFVFRFDLGEGCCP